MEDEGGSTIALRITIHCKKMKKTSKISIPQDYYSDSVRATFSHEPSLILIMINQVLDAKTLYYLTKVHISRS